MAKYLITGGNGFIGANLAKFLVDKGNEVWITSRENKLGWRLKNVNIAGVYKFKKPEHFDYIYHLSAAGCYYGKDSDYAIVMANIVDTYALLTYFANTDYKAFIYTDSSSSYGTKNSPMQEKDVLEPSTMYAAAKGSGTLLCRAHAKTYDKPIAIARLFSVYGQLEEPSRFIPTLIDSARTGKEVSLGDGVHDWVHVDDAIDALFKLREYADSRGEIFNVGTGVQTSNLQVLKYVETIMDKSINYTMSKPLRIFDTNTWVADISKISKFWSPKLDIIEGLTKTIKHDKPKKRLRKTEGKNH